MTRSQLLSRFRAENPEITERVATDTVIYGWMFDADKEFCAVTKCIISNIPETFNSVADRQYYDLTTNIDKFYEIDEYPGGGVWYNNDPLTKCTESEMNYVLTNWKSADSGTPEKYFRRGKYIWFDIAPDTADIEIAVSTVFISDDFDDDTKTPFNVLSYLEPFHTSILKYIQWKAKQKVGKDNEALKAESEYYSFLSRTKILIQGGQNDKAFLINEGNSGYGNAGGGCF